MPLPQMIIELIKTWVIINNITDCEYQNQIRKKIDLSYKCICMLKNIYYIFCKISNVESNLHVSYMFKYVTEMLTAITYTTYVLKN